LLHGDKRNNLVLQTPSWFRIFSKSAYTSIFG
jgi:hypothetical protein